MDVIPFPSFHAGGESDPAPATAAPAHPAPVPAALDRLAKPFTPETLGERWGCSGNKIRHMFHDGELAGFRLGKLIRIPAVEVERYECAQTRAASATSSSSIEESLPSRSVAARIAADTRRELMTRASLG